MKIVINCVGWAKELRGVDRYYIELLRELLTADSKNHYYVFAGTWQDYIEEFREFKNVTIITVSWPSARLFRNLWHGFVFPILAKRLKPDIIHLPNTMPLFYKVCPTICTIHDLLEYVYPETFGRLQTLMRKLIVKTETKLADQVITVSDLTKNSLVDVLHVKPDKIRTVISGINTNMFYALAVDRLKLLKLFNIKKNYILFVGVLEKKKNLTGLVNAYQALPAKIRDNYQLVFAGKRDNAYESTRSLITALDLTGNVVFLDHIGKNLLYLYQGATLFVLPSHYEGFGLPVFEALACGVPAVISKNIAVARLLHDCVELIDPQDRFGITAGMLKLLTNKELRDRRIADGILKVAGFTWKRSAQETLQCYRECIALARAKRL